MDMADLECPPIWEAENMVLSIISLMLRRGLIKHNNVDKSNEPNTEQIKLYIRVYTLWFHLFKTGKVNVLLKSLKVVILLERLLTRIVIHKGLLRCW